MPSNSYKNINHPFELTLLKFAGLGSTLSINGINRMCWISLKKYNDDSMMEGPSLLFICINKTGTQTHSCKYLYIYIYIHTHIYIYTHNIWWCKRCTFFPKMLQKIMVCLRRSKVSFILLACGVLVPLI